MTQKRLSSKVVIVTGAARGQGAAHARRLASEGAKVLLADVLDETGVALAKELRAESLDVRYEHLDVADAEQWSRVAEIAFAEFGNVTTLVNNAGVSSRPGVDDWSEAEWQRVVGINQTGVLLGMNAVIPQMRAAGGGSIINVSSIWAHTGGVGPGNIAYVATKSAVLGMTKNAALDLGRHGIRVNSVSPGYIDHLMGGERDNSIDGIVARVPLQRLAQPEEISGAVAFLASEDSSYISGIDLLIDGGLHLG